MTGDLIFLTASSFLSALHKENKSMVLRSATVPTRISLAPKKSFPRALPLKCKQNP
uniref:Uncharacterized protein n=1 Tax=Anguilla anguilla TaxID=7936 RepID=A0A0E9TRE9_ANGAN